MSVEVTPVEDAGACDDPGDPGESGHGVAIAFDDDAGGDLGEEEG